MEHLPRSPSPSGNGDSLYDVAATSPSDAWAVGIYGDPAFDEPLVKGFVKRRDGSVTEPACEGRKVVISQHLH